MNTLSECRFLNRTFAIDDLSKKPHGPQIKFKRAFQFLQLLLLQRAYRLNFVSCTETRRSLRQTSQTKTHLSYEQQNNYQVFLGGSCNPTTWRHDDAIPYLNMRSVSYYNPQVADWTPDLVEIEHRAKELAPLLFFVIDNDTRALASMIEVCYLAARERTIVVAMNRMPEKSKPKFIQQKTIRDPLEDERDYQNVWEAQRTVRNLLRTLDIPVFDNIREALQCAAYVLDTTKRSVSHNFRAYEDKNEDNDILTPLPSSPYENHHCCPSSVVVIRSLSNKTSFDTPDEFYQQMRHENMTPLSPLSLDTSRSSTDLGSMNEAFKPVPVCEKRQISCSTNETEDDGYGSLSSSNRTLSISSSSLSSDFVECPSDPSRDGPTKRTTRTRSASVFNNWLSHWYSYIPFVNSTPSNDLSVTQSIFVLFTLPFRFLKTTLLPPPLSIPSISSAEEDVGSSASESSLSTPSSPPPLFRSIYDLYIAAGTTDQNWLKSFALPMLEEKKLKHTMRQTDCDDDQSDGLYDIHLRKQSTVLFYMINGHERLSQLATELAFLIGQRKHKIVVYLETSIDEHSNTILSPCERRDIQRSRKYLEDIAMKENIFLSKSREECWRYVLTYFQNSDD